MLIIFRMELSPLLYMAPRGLITILLFLSIPKRDKLDIVNNALIMQVVILTALIMMIGNLTYKSISLNQEIADNSDLPEDNEQKDQINQPENT